jgi:hypothetical protein
MSPDREVTPDPLQAPDDGARRAILKGVGAAILGGAAWALIVALTNMEVGYVAWGIGGLVGFTMTKATKVRGTRMALAAASLAVAGLLIGKLLIMQYVTVPAVAEELRADTLGPARAAAWELEADSALPTAVQAQLDALAPEDTVPDALWEEMVAAGASHLARMPAAERDSYATAYAAAVQSSIGVRQMLLWQFSPWDLLWLFLAVSTAWSMLVKPVEPAPAAADPVD